MKICGIDGIKEIRIETACGRHPVEIREAFLSDGVLTLSLNIDQEAAEQTTSQPSLESDERKIYP
jgi:hypothetical protein